MEKTYTKSVIQEIKKFIGKDNIEFLKKEFKDNSIYLIYTSRYNMAGTAIRNHIRNEFKEIDKDFRQEFGDDWYAKFEDWLHLLIEKAIFDYA